MANPSFPRVLALLVCDEIQPREDDARVHDLFGVRAEIRASSFPHEHSTFGVYAQVSGRDGSVPGHLEIIQVNEEGPLLITPEQEVQLAGPLVAIPAVWWIESCTFPVPVLYYVQLYFGTKLVSERLLVLSETHGVSDGNGQA
jgi:hypothetical protein